MNGARCLMRRPRSSTALYDDSCRKYDTHVRGCPERASSRLTGQGRNENAESVQITASLFLPRLDTMVRPIYVHTHRILRTSRTLPMDRRLPLALMSMAPSTNESMVLQGANRYFLHFLINPLTDERTHRIADRSKSNW